MIRHCIIGGGPVGLTLASFFKKFNIPFVLIERSENVSSHPSAHYINLRSREVFEELPNINTQIDKTAETLENVRNYTYLRRIGEQPFIQSDQFAPSIQEKLQSLQQISFAHPTHLPQNFLVQILMNSLKDGQSENIFQGLMVNQIQKSQKGYKVIATNKEGKDQTFETQFIYGCDGLNGIVRKFTNIPMLGQPSIQNFLNVHFESKSLADLVLKNKSMLTFIYNSDIVAVLIAHQIRNGIFTIQIPLDTLFNASKYNRGITEKQQIEQITNEQVVKMIQSVVTKDHTLSDVSVKSIGVWRMGAVVAANYFQNGIVLVGDAAHALPPSGGFGMNTGIQDAHNLAHKIKFLESSNYEDVNQTFQQYQNERQKIAYENINTSLRYYQKSLQIAKAIGFDQKNLKMFQGVYGRVSSLLNPSMSSSLIEAEYFLNKARSQLNKLQLQGDDLIPLILPKEEVEFQYQHNIKQQFVGKLIPNYKISNDPLGLRHHVQQSSKDQWVVLTFKTTPTELIQDLINNLNDKPVELTNFKDITILQANLTNDEPNLLDKLFIIRSDQHIFYEHDL